MIRHETLNPPLHVYPINPWKIIETSFYPRFLAQTETLFSLGNGYLGLRGNFEEGRPYFQRGTFINGFHETWPIVYSEGAYGFAKTGQTMLNVTDSKGIFLYIDDEPFSLPAVSLQLYQRTLDMQAGTLDRQVLLETPSGKRALIESRRLVSFEHRHLAAFSYQVTLLNAEAPVIISSEIIGAQENQTGSEDPRQAKGFVADVLIPQSHFCNQQRLCLGHQTHSSGMTLVCAIDHQFETECPYQWHSECSENEGRVEFRVDAKPGQPIQLVKFVAYHSSQNAPVKKLCTRAEWTLDRAQKEGFKALLDSQRNYLDDFWHRSDVKIDAASEEQQATTGEFQQALRWSLFQILQASARAEGTSIPAKGLTGQTYEGHYFWDTEIYVLPFMTYSTPHIARNLLRFRHSMLDRARQRALELNQKGALFPWRTINGEEASANYAAGTAQYHINADIMFALRKYIEVTDDKALLFNEGAEMLVETARLWYDIGFFSKSNGGQFCIHGVTGPDEYTTVVNNNTFTNLMARENLRYAVETVSEMEQHHPEHFATLVHRTALQMTEVADWQQAAERMYIPFDQNLGINPQDDNFLDREVWDIKATPRDRFPLLLYHHPLVIYRHQVLKQADVVLAMFLLGKDFTRTQKKHNFNYYDPLTTGDSSLSACIQAIIAAEINDLDKAVKYARYAVLMDLADIGGNVKDGCHIASMGGTWMVAVYGFAGMRDDGGALSFDPHLPKQMGRLQFPLCIRGQSLEVTVEPNKASYLLREGTELTIFHRGHAVHLTQGQVEVRAD